MPTTFRAHGWLKHCEEDIYETGCVLGSEFSHSLSTGHECFSARSAELLLNSLKTFTGSTDTTLDACDEPGRVDIQGYEDIFGLTPSDEYLEEWKKGLRRLWLCTYTFHIEACTPVMFKRPLTTDVRTQTKDWTPEQRTIGRPLNQPLEQTEIPFDKGE